MDPPTGIPERILGLGSNGELLFSRREGAVFAKSNAALPLDALAQLSMVFYFEVTLTAAEPSVDVSIGYENDLYPPPALSEGGTVASLAVGDTVGAGFEAESRRVFFTLNGAVVTPMRPTQSRQLQQQQQQRDIFAVVRIGAGGEVAMKATFGEEGDLKFDVGSMDPPLHFSLPLLAAHLTKLLVAELLAPPALAAASESCEEEGADLLGALERMDVAAPEALNTAEEMAWLRDGIQLLSELASQLAAAAESSPSPRPKWTASDMTASDIEGLAERALAVQRRVVKLITELPEDDARRRELVSMQDLVLKVVEQVDLAIAALLDASQHGNPPLDLDGLASEASVTSAGSTPEQDRCRLLQHRILALICSLRSRSPVGKAAAARMLAVLARQSEEARRQIIRAGGLHSLLDVVCRCKETAARSQLQRQAAAAITFVAPAVRKPLILAPVAPTILAALRIVLSCPDAAVAAAETAAEIAAAKTAEIATAKSAEIAAETATAVSAETTVKTAASKPAVNAAADCVKGAIVAEHRAAAATLAHMARQLPGLQLERRGVGGSSSSGGSGGGQGIGGSAAELPSPKRRPRTSSSGAAAKGGCCGSEEATLEGVAISLFSVVVKLLEVGRIDKKEDDEKRQREEVAALPSQPLVPLTLSRQTSRAASGHPDEETTTLLADAVATLVQNDDCRVVLIDLGAIRLLEQWLASGQTGAVRHSAAAIAALCSKSRVGLDVYTRGWIDAQLVSEGVLRALLPLAEPSWGEAQRATRPKEVLEVKLHVVCIVSQLCAHTQNRSAIVEAGGIPTLVRLLADAAALELRRDAGTASPPASEASNCWNQADEREQWSEVALKALQALCDLSRHDYGASSDVLVSSMIKLGVSKPVVALARHSRRPSLTPVATVARAEGSALAVPAIPAMMRSASDPGMPTLSASRNGSWLVVSRITTTPLRLAAVQLLSLLSECRGNMESADLVEAGALDVLLAVAVDADPPLLARREDELEDDEALRQRVAEQREEAIQAAFALANLSEIPAVAPCLNRGNAAEVLLLLCERGLRNNVTEVVNQGIRGLAALLPHLLPIVAEQSPAHAGLGSAIVTANGAGNGTGGPLFAAPSKHLVSQVLQRVLVVVIDSMESQNGLVQLQALKALSLLARHAPYQLAIVESALQVLLALAVDVLGNEELSELASQVLVSLGFAGGRKDLEVCGNDYTLLRDWYYLERALEVQRLAEEEIWLMGDMVWLRALEVAAERSGAAVASAAAAEANGAQQLKRIGSSPNTSKSSKGSELAGSGGNAGCRCGQAPLLSTSVRWPQVSCMLRSTVIAPTNTALPLRAFLEQRGVALAQAWHGISSTPLLQSPPAAGSPGGNPDVWLLRTPLAPLHRTFGSLTSLALGPPQSPAVLALKGVKSALLGCAGTSAVQNNLDDEEEHHQHQHQHHPSGSSQGDAWGDISAVFEAPAVSPAEPRGGGGSAPMQQQPRQRDPTPPAVIVVAGTGELSQRVQKLLDIYLPSRLYQQLLVPLAPRGVDPLRPRAALSSDVAAGEFEDAACFGGQGLSLPRYRALLMPKRQYFSFGREGRVLVEVLARNAGGSRRLSGGGSSSGGGGGGGGGGGAASWAASSAQAAAAVAAVAAESFPAEAAAAPASEDIPSLSEDISVGEAAFVAPSSSGWALVFRDSSFTGDFLETLIQATMRCPAINSITFAARRGHDEKADLGYLAGRLPPTVKYLVFDSALSAKELHLLGSMLASRKRRSWSVGGDQCAVGGLLGLAVKSHRTLKPADFANLLDAIKDEGGAGPPGGNDGRDGRSRSGSDSAGNGKSSGGSGGSNGGGGGSGGEKDLSLGGKGALAMPRRLSPWPLFVDKDLASGIKWLDLSGNGLGDTGSSQVIAAVSRCRSLLHLDLSNNSIKKGEKTMAAIAHFMHSSGNGSVAANAAVPAAASAASAAAANGDDAGYGNGNGGGAGGRGVWLRTLLLNSNYLTAEAVRRLLTELTSDHSLVKLGLSYNSLGKPSPPLGAALRACLKHNSVLTDLDLRCCGLEEDVVAEAMHGLLSAEPPGSALRFLRLRGNPAVLAATAEVVEEELERARYDYFHSVYQERHGRGSGGGGGGGSSSRRGSAERNGMRELQPSSGKDAYLAGGRLPDNSSDAPNAYATAVATAVASPVPGSSSDGNGAAIVVPLAAAAPATAAAAPPGHALTVLFAAPLAYHDTLNHNQLRGIAQLDFGLEREMLCSTFLESGRDIRVQFDFATTKRLRSAVTLQAKALHYSGHGHQSYLAFEDSFGGLHPIQPEALRSLCAAGSDSALEFVFVSACHSRRAADAFAAAGVPHVVCVKLEEQLLDVAARSFTSAFYLALAVGHTVQGAFDIGREAVATDPHVPNSEAERDKFLLLPEGSSHDAAIFPNARPLSTRRLLEAHKLPRDGSGGGSGGAACLSPPRGVGGAASSSVDLAHLPAPPGEDFCGREVILYLSIKAIMGKRLVSLVGDAGCGKSSVAVAMSHYVAARRYFRDGVFFVKANGQRTREDLAAAMVEALSPYMHLRSRQPPPLPQQQRQQPPQTSGEASAGQGRAPANANRAAEANWHRSWLASALGDQRCLIVLDEVESFQATDGGVGIKLFLGELFEAAPHIRIFTTSSQHPSKLVHVHGAPQEVFVTLPPLSAGNAVTLFAHNCRLLKTNDDRQSFIKDMVDPQQADLTVNMRGLLPKTARVLEELGDGNPAQILRRAYNINTEEKFEALCCALAPNRARGGGIGRALGAGFGLGSGICAGVGGGGIDAKACYDDGARP